MVDLVFFGIFALIAVLCAINVVVQRHPISSALSLVGVMGSLAVLYLMLGGEFIAMAQIIVYAGAVMVLFVFVIMLLNAGIEVRRGRSWTATILGAPALLGLLGVLACLLARWFPNSPVIKFGDFTAGAQQVGYALFTGYLLPFEVTSVLILIAILGAVVLARKELD
ncbi:MAG TPA: NADH-quinone oxidoreductase subunit J [Bryobacteraceae bacterium]|nr:NADH-quinone oxidoreductase subunit J [Bryobacteraceae bacterium]